MGVRASFRMEDEYITMVRGNTLSFNIEVLSLQDLDNAFFTIKKDIDSDDYLVQLSLGNGITRLETGLYVVRLSPTDTYGIDVGKYWYDLQVRKNGDIFTVKRGILELVSEVTREDQT